MPQVIQISFTLDPASISLQEGESIHIAGEFSSPAWHKLVPMTLVTDQNGSKSWVAHTTITIPDSESPQAILQVPIQYKFFIPSRSLWFTGKDLPTSTNASGYTNHVLVPWDQLTADAKSTLIHSHAQPRATSSTSSLTTTPSATETAPLRDRIISSSSDTSSVPEEAKNPLSKPTMPPKADDRIRIRRHTNRNCPRCTTV